MTQNIAAINQWFKQAGQRVVRWRWIILAFLVLLTVIAIFGLGKLRFQVSVEDWFLEDDPLMIAKREFKQLFGNQEYVGILLEADDVFAPETLRLIRELGDELKQNVLFADKVISLTDFEFTRGTGDGVEIRNLVPDEIPSDQQAIEEIRRLAFSKTFLINRLFSDDSRQAWIMLRLLPYPEDAAETLKQDPAILVGEDVLKILGQGKYQQLTLTPAGTPALAAQEVAFFTKEANRLILLSILVAILVLFLALRTIRGVLIPMASFISSAIWVFGAMGYLGVKVNNTFITLPIYLGVAVSIGYSIHLFNFFQRQFSSTGNRRDSVIYAIEETGWPIFFTATTTIGALLSFYFVPIRQVRWMGFSSAAMIAAIYVLVMTMTPILLSFGKNRSPQQEGHHPQSRVHLTLRHFAHAFHTFDSWTDQMLIRLSHWILEHPKQIMMVFILLVLFFANGMRNVYISTDYKKAYGLKIPYVNDLYYVGHTKVGSMYSYNVTLAFDEPGIVKTPEILKAFETLSKEIQTFSLVTRVSSLLDIIKDMNQVMNNDDPAYYRIPDDQELIAQLLLLYEFSEGTEQAQWVDYDYTTLRLMVEVKEFDSAEVEREFQQINQRVQALFPEAQFGMVGTLMQLSMIQNYVARGEIISFLVALAVIGILMILVFQSIQTGLIGMIPNLAPVLVIFGLMGYLDIPLDMTTMIIVPILLGLAVDDTIHVINHSKLEFQRTGKYRDGIQQTFQTVGKAIFMTSFILIASFSAYMTSIALGFVHLAILMTAGVLSALLADYFITPILVDWSKPFGEEVEP